MNARATSMVRNRATPAAVRVSEELLFPRGGGNRRELRELLRLMARRHGCLSCTCRRSGNLGDTVCFRLVSCWATREDFADWTGCLHFAAIEAQLTGRRLRIEDLPPTGKTP